MLFALKERIFKMLFTSKSMILYAEYRCLLRTESALFNREK